MTARLIDGRRIADEVLAEAASQIADLKGRHGVTPGLAAVLVGEDPASALYVRNKMAACRKVGVVAETLALTAESGEDSVVETISALNQDARFHGILVQLRLLPHLHEEHVVAAISPTKNVDGLHPLNLGRLAAGAPGFVPATPLGIQTLLLRSGIDPQGKHVVILGRSNIVGKPLALLLMQKAPGANATVTVCHTGTRNIGSLTIQADILVVDTGQPRWVTGEMIKEWAVVIDVGVNRVEDLSDRRGYRLVGDVDFESVQQKAAAITPVPRGVGPVTVAMLISNTVKAARLSVERRIQAR